MKKRYKKITIIVLTFNSFLISFAQEIDNLEQNKTSFFKKNVDYQARAQFSIGGASPIGIPAEIRKIESYNPTLQLGIGINATKWLNDKQKYGIRVGLYMEGRGMKTQAKVKNYYTQIEDDTGAQTKGFFTGHVITEMDNAYISVPVLFVWNASNNWNFYGGFYFSALIDKSFSGYIYDGTFREGSPIGEPTTFENTAKGLYDFSDNLSPFQWGSQLGTEFKIKSNFSIFLDATMGHKQIFKKNFEAISFKMYSIYGNAGFAYIF
ncbi:outer membrane beta-barrel protein [Empedobacter brevis]